MPTPLAQHLPDELSASRTALLRLTVAPVQAGGSLAGKDSRIASSTGREGFTPLHPVVLTTPPRRLAADAIPSTRRIFGEPPASNRASRPLPICAAQARPSADFHPSAPSPRHPR